MIAFTTTIKKFGSQGEKTGWTYIELPAALAEQLNPATKTSFRVKGKLDQYAINGVALLPMGGGSFIMALNATVRKGIGKGEGASLQVQLERDKQEREPPPVFVECLADEPAALDQYNRLQKSHKTYFTVWLTSVKTEAAQAKRIAQAVNALAKGQNFVQMIRSLKIKRTDY